LVGFFIALVEIKKIKTAKVEDLLKNNTP